MRGLQWYLNFAFWWSMEGVSLKRKSEDFVAMNSPLIDFVPIQQVKQTPLFNALCTAHVCVMMKFEKLKHFHLQWPPALFHQIPFLFSFSFIVKAIGTGCVNNFTRGIILFDDKEVWTGLCSLGIGYKSHENWRKWGSNFLRRKFKKPLRKLCCKEHWVKPLLNPSKKLKGKNS